MPLVLDASVCFTWCFPDEASAYGDRVLNLLRETGAMVPPIWPLEIANVLLVGERRQRLTPAQTVQFVNSLQSLPITVHEVDPARALGPVVALAREQNLSAYDASYLDLAIQSALPLATQDARLSAAAARLGVPLVP